MAVVAQRMRAAYLVEPGRVELREVPVPVPGPGQLLLRIERALAGGTDRKAFQRGHPKIPMPGPFGHRYVGTIAAVGPAETAELGRWEIGQAVMGVHSAPCLVCGLCRRGRHNLCPQVMREKALGAFGEYLLIPAAVARQNLFLRPMTLPVEQATLLEPVSCIVHALETIQWSGVERVLILGLGAVGLLFGQLLPLYTPAQRVAAGRRRERVELARGWGLHPVYDLTQIPLAEQLPPQEQFDVVLECTGKMEGWQEAVRRTAPGGQVLLFGGLPRGSEFLVDTYRLHYEEVTLRGSFHFAPRDVILARDYLLQGAVDSTGLISATYPLARICEALERLLAGDGVQFAIDPAG
ncbi:MAG: alcohol dehydrogenase catalytic domain-containing protein [Gemmataceae bacterium]